MSSLDSPIDKFAIRGQDGVFWHAPRQRLACRIYRVPDDPTTPEDLIAAHMTLAGGLDATDLIERDPAVIPGEA